MRLKASIIVEDSIIIPLFTIIIVVLVMTGMYMHDEIIKDYAYLQAAMKIEQNNNCEEDELYVHVKSYINQRTITQNITLDKYEDITKVGALIKENNQADFIRKNNALKISSIASAIKERCKVSGVTD